MLFSATMPQEIVKLATAQMDLPLRIEVVPPGTAAANVEQELFIVRKEEKLLLLSKLLSEYNGTVLVFSRTKHGAKKITQVLKTAGHKVAEIHANRTLVQRRAALDGFKKGIYRVLIATDIAARGIDVTGIEVVINFDLPDDAGDYVHRIGRTGRAGRKGRAISFAAPDQAGSIRDIERLIRSPIKRSLHPSMPSAPYMPSANKPGQFHRTGGGGGGRGGGGRRRGARQFRPRRRFGQQRIPIACRIISTLRAARTIRCTRGRVWILPNGKQNIMKGKVRSTRARAGRSGSCITKNSRLWARRGSAKRK